MSISVSDRLSLAEQHVDWHRVQRHIDQRRQIVERAAVGPMRKIASSVALNGHVVHDHSDLLAARIEAALDATALFGFRSAQAEIRSLRRQPVTLAYEIPDVGSQAAAAQGGLDGVRRLVKTRARQAADRVVTAAFAGYEAAQTAQERHAAILLASRRALHRVVLELVGETLNQGRTAGALALPGPPEFAIRSGELDKNSCEPCDKLSGTVAQVGSSEYYDISPPSYCLGGGRCRCIWVFGDSPQQFTKQQAA